MTSKPKQLQGFWHRNITHRELALADPLYFMGYYMEQRCLPHREAFLEFFMQPDTHKLLLAPREHWKTSTLTGYILWRILHNPNIRICIISNTMKLSTDIVTNLRDLLDRHPLIIRDFGHLRTDHWGKEAFTIPRPPKLRIKEPTVTAAGVMGGSILGSHFDLVWCDDIVKEENQWTPEQRDKVLKWFEGTLLRCCDHEMIITGTRKNIYDLYSVLMERGGYTYKVYKAILNEETGELLAPGLKEPDLDTYDWLLSERRRMGSLMFAQEMQNEPIAMEGLELKRDWLQYYDPAHPPDFNWLYMGVDPAVGKSDTASYTATCLIGVTPDLRFYVLDFQRGRWHVEWEKKIIALWERYCEMGRSPLVVAVEAVMTFQYVTLPLVEKSSMPVRFVNYRQKDDTQVKDKMARIRALGTHFENRRIYLPHPNQYDLTRIFEKEEYLVFPEKEGHTDMLDALNLAINEAPRSIEEESFWGC